MTTTVPTVSLRAQLDAIHARRGGLTPAILVEEATPQDHPLHHRFEWDDSVAGPAYRRVQAARLIRSVRVVRPSEDDEADPIRVRAFQAIPQEGRKTHDYVPLDELDDNAARLLIKRMELDWRSMQRRYGHFAAFWEMIRKDVAEVDTPES